MADTELKKLPSGHAIHGSCFKRLYSPRQGSFQCPACERKSNGASEAQILDLHTRGWPIPRE
jgi:hypothetical protein